MTTAPTLIIKQEHNPIIAAIIIVPILSPNQFHYKLSPAKNIQQHEIPIAERLCSHKI